MMTNSSNIELKSKLHNTTCKVSRFKEQIKKTKPHKHDNYYELIILLEGSGFHQIESTHYLIQAPVCFVLQPGQMHYWQFTSIPKGYVILFSNDEFDALHEKNVCLLYKQLAFHTHINISKETLPIALLEELYKVYSEPNHFSQLIIHGLLQSLFATLLITTQNHDLQAQSMSLPFEQFNKLIQQHIHTHHKVYQYAALLNMTPQNLNAICLKHGKTNAVNHINNHLLLEAKRYILHTEKTIAEIADLLSFSDSSHFVKFFKKYEGITPVQFRQQFFQ